MQLAVVLLSVQLQEVSMTHGKDVGRVGMRFNASLAFH